MNDRGPRLKAYMASTETPSYEGIAKASAEDAEALSDTLLDELRGRIAAVLVNNGGDTIPRADVLALIETSDFAPVERIADDNGDELEHGQPDFPGQFPA